MRVTILLLILGITENLFSQAVITISGPSPVAPGSQQTYIADLGVRRQYPSSIVTWSVTGGTIISRITNPSAPSVYCVVQWGTQPGQFTISASINVPAQAGQTSVTVANEQQPTCVQANAGNDAVVCAGGSVTIGTPAVPGYSYIWSPATGLNNPYIAQPVASPLQTTEYRVKVKPQPVNLIQNGDFENGNVGFGTDYPAYPNTIDTYGTQSVTTNPRSMFAGWCNMPDYSQHGHMFVADAPIVNDPANYRFWYTAVNVRPNTWYSFFLWKAPVSANPSSVALTFTGNNSGIQRSSFDVFATSWPLCQAWSGYGISWYSGSNTGATIDMRFLAIPENLQNSNDLAIDEISFTEITECPVTTDLVTVSIGSPPRISPSGPIDYYYLSEMGTGTIGITLTANEQPGYQWYKNGIVIEGAVSQTYKAKSEGSYTVRSAGCESVPVIFNERPWGPNTRTIIGESLNYPAGITSPSYYCYNSSNYIQQFDLGPAANYKWETYDYYNSPQQPQLYINPSTYNIHSPRADVVINPDPPSVTFILGYAELAGYVKAMEFYGHYYSSVSTPRTFPTSACPGNIVTITNYNPLYVSNNYLNPGASQFDWETYDVGPNGTILTPDPSLYPDPADPSNLKRIRIPGKNGYSEGITVRLNSLLLQINKYFYSSNGDCYQDSKAYFTGNSCRSNTADRVTLYPNPAKNNVTIKASDPILSVEITGINSPGAPQLVQKNSGTKTLNLNLGACRPGVYNCRVTTASGVFNEKLVIAP